MSKCNKIIEKLIEVASHIRRIESKASKALYYDNNKIEYGKYMREKAEMLLNLSAQTDHLLKDHDDVRALVSSRLDGFATNAAMSLELDSLFFMSALLYPEDYREGDNNDLENFIIQLEEFCEQQV